jgi:AraC-like DNA-binding protein
MKYSYHKPDPKLQPFVQTVLVVNGNPRFKASDLPLFSNGMPALFYQFNNTSSHQLTIFGKSIPDEKWIIDESTTLIAFLFKPFSLAPLFKISAKDLKDNAIELPLWNAQKSMTLRLQLARCQSTEEHVQVLNHFLISQLIANKRKCEIIHFATDRLMLNTNTDVLTEILSSLNLTERTFQRIFKQYTGVTANQYRRICQFYFAFSELKAGKFEKQSDVAYSNNYFDQSHYIRSFREFTDTTPNDYLQFGLDKKIVPSQ